MARRKRKTKPVSAVAAAEELALLRRVVDGDQQAWAIFCNRYVNFVGGCVSRVLRRYVVQLTAESLDDLVAEVWVALLRDRASSKSLRAELKRRRQARRAQPQS